MTTDQKVQELDETTELFDQIIQDLPDPESMPPTTKVLFTQGLNSPSWRSAPRSTPTGIYDLINTDPAPDS